MAVVSCYKLFTSRGGSLDFQRRRTYREQWEVCVDSMADDEQTVSLAVGLPRIAQRHPRDPNALCVKVEPTQSEDAPLIWYVAIEYDSKPDWPTAQNPDGTPQIDIPENPLLRPAVWKITGQKTSEAVGLWRYVDAAGNMAATATMPSNSAKLPFDPSLMAEVSRPVLRVTKNVPLITLAYLLSLQDAVNDKPWKGIPKWCARVDSYDSGNKNENGVAYVELTLDIALKGETWLTRVLDAGLLELTRRPTTDAGPKEKWTKIKDPFGHESDSPQPLDGNGKRLLPDADPVFRRGLPANYHLADFDSLIPF